MLDSALEVFLDRGYEQATVDMIAAAAGMTKRTVYARYEDKTALFKAVVQRAIDQYKLPLEAMKSADRGDLAETLTSIARMRLAHVLSPTGLRLQRILNAESYRYPDIFNSAFEQGTKPLIDFLAEVLARHAAAGHAEISDPQRAATVFMSMVVGGPARIFISGNTISDDELDARTRFSVDLFLRGVLPRSSCAGR